MNSFHEVLSTITGTAVLVTVLLIGSLAAKMHRDGLWLALWHVIPARVRWGQRLEPGAMRAVLDLDPCQMQEGQKHPGKLVRLNDLDAGSDIRALWPVVR
jgi:hypothetical protein